MRAVKSFVIVILVACFVLTSCQGVWISSSPEEKVSLPIQVQTPDWFGMGSNTHMRTENIEDAYREMAGIGVKFVREDIPWQEIQVGNEGFNFDYRNGALSRALNAARSNGLQVVGILAYTPGNGVTYNTAKEFVRHWQNYVTAVVQTFGEKIDYWEIGNEINTWWNKVRPGVTDFEPEVYAEMLKSAYLIIKKQNPNDVVIMSSLVNIDSRAAGLDPVALISKIKPFDPEKYCDAINLHVYWEGQDPDELRPNLVNGKTETLNMAGYVAKVIVGITKILGERMPVWITEVGFNQSAKGQLANRYNTHEDLVQSIVLVKSYITLLSIPRIQSVFWYSWLNDETGQTYAMSDMDKSAYHTLTMAIAGSKALGNQQAVDGSGNVINDVADYRFKRADGRTISYYWSAKPEPESYQAVLVPMTSGAVTHYGALHRFSDGTILEDPSIQSFRINAVPRVMLGTFETDTKISLGAKQEPEYGKARMTGSLLPQEGDYFYITYDKSIWEIKEESNTPELQAIRLKQDPKCVIDSFGTPDGGDISLESSTKEILGVNFYVTDWSSGGKTWMANIGRDQNVLMSVFFGENVETCRKYIWDVIELSQKDNFGLQPIQPPALETIEYGGGFALKFDPTYWEIADFSGWVYLKSLNFEGCNIQYQYGHGIDPNVFSVESWEETIGNSVFSISRWDRIATGETILYLFVIDQDFISVEGPNAEPLPQECINQAYDVIRNSEAAGFRP